MEDLGAALKRLSASTASSRDVSTARPFSIRSANWSHSPGLVLLGSLGDHNILDLFLASVLMTVVVKPLSFCEGLLRPAGYPSARSPNRLIILASLLLAQVCCRVFAQAPPPNDMFTSAIPISGAVVTVTGSNLGATQEPGENVFPFNHGGKSIWWSWTAPSNGTFVVDTIGSSFDTILSVRQGTSVSSLTAVAADDDSGSNCMSRASFTATGGTVYSICVDGYNPSVSSSSGGLFAGTNDLSAASGDAVVNIRPSAMATILISRQPVGVTNLTGATFSLSVVASPVQQYQWFKDGAPLPGAQAATYSVSQAQDTNSGLYYVVLQNGAGTATSSNANVVIGPVVITSQPLSVTVATGYKAQFSVTALAQSAITYQWEKNGAPIVGATSTTLTIPVAQSSDAGSYRVRAITDQGSVPSSNAALTVLSYTFGTLAGMPGFRGSLDRSGTEARLSHPAGLAMDPGGSLYVTEYDGYTIRKVTPDGLVTRIAGLWGHAGTNDGPALDARFDCPEGIAVDLNTNLYVADNFNHTIRKLSLDSTGTNWTVTTLAGVPKTRGYRNGSGIQALFSQPSGVALDSSGNLYVAEYDNNCVRKVAPDGYVTTVIGTKANLGKPTMVSVGRRWEFIRHDVWRTFGRGRDRSRNTRGRLHQILSLRTLWRSARRGGQFLPCGLRSLKHSS